MLTHLPRSFIIIPLLCGLSLSLIKLDSIAIHPAGVELSFPDFSPCTPETRESAVGVFHSHFWPKINKSGRASYEITNCLEKGGDASAQGKDYEIIVQINSKSCTFKLKHDPTRPLEAQELLNDIEEQIKLCAEEKNKEPESSAVVVPEYDKKVITDEEHLKMIDDLLKEEDETFVPQVPKNKDNDSKKESKEKPYIFTKEHAKLYDPLFDAFANDSNDNSDESGWNNLIHSSRIADKEIQDELDSDDEERAYFEEQRRQIKEKLQHDKQPTIPTPEEEDISDEEEQKYLEELRRDIKQKYTAIEKIDPRLDSDKKEKIKEDLEKQILDETAIYNKELDRLSKSKIQEQPQPEEPKDDLVEQIPIIVHRPHLKIWLPCSAEEKQRVFGYFNQLISEEVLKPVVIYKQNFKGCFTLQMQPNTLEVQLSFNLKVCNFYLKKEENESIKLEVNDELRSGNCRNLIGARNSQQ